MVLLLLLYLVYKTRPIVLSYVKQVVSDLLILVSCCMKRRYSFVTVTTLSPSSIGFVHNRRQDKRAHHNMDGHLHHHRKPKYNGFRDVDICLMYIWLLRIFQYYLSRFLHIGNFTLCAEVFFCKKVSSPNPGLSRNTYKVIKQ
jgi:hypothetical protein